MQLRMQATRRKSLMKLSLLAGGAIAFSAATGLLTGCGGGGGGSGITSPTPISVPVLPPLATITPQTPAAAVNTFQTQFGLPTVLGAQVGAPIINVGATLQQLLTLDTFIVPTYTTVNNGAAASLNGAPSLAAQTTGLTLETARQAGLTQAELNAIIQILRTGKEMVVVDTGGIPQIVSLPVVRVGDTVQLITFTYHGQQYPTVVFVHSNGTIGYNPVLFAQPGTSEQRQVPNNQDETNRLPSGGSTVQSVITNRNPYDGHFHYEFTLSAQAAFNNQTGNATLSHPQAVVNFVGPFVSASPPTAPTITKVAASIGVRASGAPSQLLQSTGEFQFKYARHLVWDIKELIRLLIRNKTVTGSTGGSG